MSARTARRASQREAMGFADTRGSRFANRMAGIEGPTFADLAAVPRWLMLPNEEQARVAMAAALLRVKSALDHELSGHKLAAIAEMVGEDLFDAVTALPDCDEAITSALPRPEDLTADGGHILHRSLPTCFATRFPEAANDADARALAETAFDLVQSL
jgi:hypothetical protein